MPPRSRRGRLETEAPDGLFDQQAPAATAPDPLANAYPDAASAPRATIRELAELAVADGAPRRAAKSTGAPRQLPFSKQFSPRQIPSLGAFLRGIDAAAGDAEKVRASVFALIYPGVPATDKPKVTMAYNAVLSARHYGLVTAKLDGLTDFGRALLALPDDDARGLAFARHIVHNLHGLELVVGIYRLSQAGRRLTKVPLAEHFEANGLVSNRDGTDINAVAAWLEAVGVYEGGGWYRLNEKKFLEVAEIDPVTTDAFARLSKENQAILEQLAALPGHKSDSSAMQRLLRGRTDLQIDGPAFASRHLGQLRTAGLIETTKTTVGRGGNFTEFQGTTLFDTDVVQRLLERIRKEGFHVTGPELSRPLADLVHDMTDAGASKDVRGRTLELFALRLLHILGLRQIRLRVRPTLSEEIDGWAEGFAPVHSRWQIQCKNTAVFSAEQAAKEIGVAVRQRSTVVLLITTGDFSDEAIDYIQDIIRGTTITIVRVNRRDIDTLIDDESAIWEVLAREAQRAYALRTGIVEALTSTGAGLDGGDAAAGAEPLATDEPEAASEG